MKQSWLNNISQLFGTFAFLTFHLALCDFWEATTNSIYGGAILGCLESIPFLLLIVFLEADLDKN